MSDVYYYGNQPMLKYKSGKKFGAVPIDKVAADLIESLQAKVEELTADLVRVRRYLDRERKTARESIAMLRQEFDEMSRYAAARESLITPLQAKVEELEDMLQSAIERESCNERRIEQLKTRLKASLQECDYCGAALKQERSDE